MLRCFQQLQGGTRGTSAFHHAWKKLTVSWEKHALCDLIQDIKRAKGENLLMQQESRLWIKAQEGVKQFSPVNHPVYEDAIDDCAEEWSIDLFNHILTFFNRNIKKS